MVMKLEVSETRWHGCRYHFVAPEWKSNHNQLLDWCIKNYGPSGDVWSVNAERWYANSGGFFFRKESDLTMFILRWS